MYSYRYSYALPEHNLELLLLAITVKGSKSHLKTIYHNLCGRSSDHNIQMTYRQETYNIVCSVGLHINNYIFLNFILHQPKTTKIIC